MPRRASRYDGPFLVIPELTLQSGGLLLPAQATLPTDPLALATHWAEQGASWLHVTLLDAPIDPKGESARTLQQIVAAAEKSQVQASGRFTSTDQVVALLQSGATRVVLDGDPDDHFIEQTLQQPGAERIVATVAAGCPPAPLDRALQLKKLGIERILYRTRTLSLSDPGELLQKSDLRVIVQGGLHTLTDLRRLRWLTTFGLEGTLLADPLYNNTFTLPDALAAVTDNPPTS